MDLGLPTVYDVWRLALPAETILCNHKYNLQQVVSWAHRMSTGSPAFGNLDENDFVLISVQHIKIVDDRLTLTKVIQSLSTRRIRAVAVEGEVTSRAVAAANKNNVCLFSLPDDTDLREVERDIVRLIVEREAQLDRRGRLIYRQLAQHSLENRGLDAIAIALQKIVKKTVVIQDENCVLTAISKSEACPYTVQDIGSLVSTKIILDRWVSKQHLDSKAPPSTTIDLPGTDWARVISTIVIEDKLVGYLSVLSPKNDLDDLDRLAIERGSLVCAVEMAKQRAVIALEHQLRGDFVDMVLTAGVTEEPALNRRAVEMGYSLDRQHIVVLIELSQNVSRYWSLVAREFRTTLLDSGIQVFFCTYDDKLVAFCGNTIMTSVKTMLMFGYRTCDRIKEFVPGLKIAMGIGQSGVGLSGLRRSFTQAAEVIEMIHSHYGGDKVIAFGDLGLYHLLHYMHNCDQFDDFYNQTLGPLVMYDNEHDATLVESLHTFFTHHGNISQTAEALHLHRNSLLYRMERINEITGMDLDDADDRFALQLALKLKPFISPGIS